MPHETLLPYSITNVTDVTAISSGRSTLQVFVASLPIGDHRSTCTGAVFNQFCMTQSTELCALATGNELRQGNKVSSLSL